MNRKLHLCCFELPDGIGYGPAVKFCRENEEGFLFAGTNEYESVVNFCPWCGFQALMDPFKYKPKKKRMRKSFGYVDESIDV